MNAERLASVIQKMVAVGPVFPPISEAKGRQSNEEKPLIDLSDDNVCFLFD